MKVAFLMHGAVSPPSGRIITEKLEYLGINSYVNYRATKIGIQKHIIDVNPTCSFDFFLHSWSFPIEKELTELYNPIVSLFENNESYRDMIFSRIKKTRGVDKKRYNHYSKTLSIKKVTELFQTYNKSYDVVIFYRYDILLMKDMILNQYDLSKVWFNKDSKLIPWRIKNPHISYGGDFYFIMNYENALNFGLNLYDSLSEKIKPNDHQFMIPYITQCMKKEAAEDDIDNMKDLAVIRLLKKINLSKSFLAEYGLTEEEVNSYTAENHINESTRLK